MNNFFKDREITALNILFSLVVIWDIYLYFLPTHIEPANYLYNVGYALLFYAAGYYGLKGAQKNFGTNMGKMFSFIGYSGFTYGTGLVIWTYYNFVLKIETPYPSLADIFFLPYAPFIAVGFSYLLKIYKSAVSKAIIWQATIIGLTFFATVAYSVIIPTFSEDISFYAKALNVIYPLSGAILLSISYISLRSSGGITKSNLNILGLSLLLQTSADTIFTYRSGKETYWNGDIGDLAFTVSAYLLTLFLIRMLKDLGRPQDSLRVSQSSL